MFPEAKVRVSKKNNLYIPKPIADAVKLRVEGSKIVLEVLLDPFDLALTAPKSAKTTFKGFEKESEKFQDELFGSD